MFWQVVGADAFWALLDTAILGAVALVVVWWRRRRLLKAGAMASSADPHCRHCARCEACITPGVHVLPGTDCTRGPYYCGRCRVELHAVPFPPPERPE